jgi:hypothetical protein
MKHLSKNMMTLTRLRQQYFNEELEDEALKSSHEVAALVSTTNPNTVGAADIVQFRPEEVESLMPLKPEEADAGVLADILQGEDLSFLMEPRNESDESGDENTMHRIPTEKISGQKRKRQ